MTDAAYEADLKACRAEGHPRMFDFRVDGVQVAVCPRCLQRFVADPLQGDGGEWDQAASRAADEAGRAFPLSSSPVPSPTPKAAGPCLPGSRRCTVRVFHGPSRVHMAHADWCPTNPGEMIDAADYAGSRSPDSQPWRVR